MGPIAAPRAGSSDFILPQIVLPLRATFFLRGLLGGLLGFLRWLLGCFLGCHFSILPFRWVASILQLETAVEECIESRSIDVKKKTTSK
jgi:predicted outer membrane lipoprotein